MLNLLGSMVPILLDRPPGKDDAITTALIALAVPMPTNASMSFRKRFGMKLTSLYGMTDMGVSGWHSDRRAGQTWEVRHRKSDGAGMLPGG